MKTIFKTLFLISSFLILTSCEDVIQIKLDEGSKIYVIDAFVNNKRTDQVIRVTTNDSYFSNREAPPVIGASVILKDLTANTQYVFNYTSNGNYVYTLASTDTIAKKDHSYELNVTIEGTTYTSFTIQRRTAVIDSIITLPQEGFGPPTTDTIFNCLLLARDRVDNIADYYWLKTYRNDSLMGQGNDINVTIDGVGGIVTSAPNDTIDFTPPATFLGFQSYRKNNTCKVEIHSISRENYFFFLQALAQINNGGLFATTPENVKTNIVTPDGAKTKAIGRFNMASVAIKTTTI